jgi:hypothetical protein
MTATKLLADNGVSSGITGYQLTGGDDGTLQLQTATAGGTATTALTINNSQNVGIGTSSPTRKLDVAGTWSNTGDYLMNSASPQLAWASGDLRFYSGGLAGTGTERMRIDSSGNVGIGTNVPIQQLHVNSPSTGGIQITNGTTGATSTDGVWLGIDSSGESYFYNYENTNIRFYANATERMRITAAGLLQFNSGYGSVATAYGCRAWVNFNGTGTVAIRSSGNVSSITDNGTGDYTMNFTNAMPDVNYGVATAINNGDTNSARYNMNIYASSQGGAPTLMSTSQLRVLCGVTHTTGVSDHNVVCISILR